MAIDGNNRGGIGTRKSVPFEFPTPCSLEGYSAAGGELAPHRALHQRAYTHNPTAWCTATAPSPVHHVLTFRLSHPCCRVRTDQLPFERDVRRSSRRTSTDAIQAAQMALVMAIDSLIGGELGRASSPASHSGQAVGGLTRQLGEPGGTTCRCVARGKRQHGALERGDALRSPVAPAHAVIAECAQTEWNVCGCRLWCMS